MILERLSLHQNKKMATVLIKGDKIAYVGKDIGKAVGSSTRIIDAAGKILIPGLIDGHTHIDSIFSISEVLRYAIQEGFHLLIILSAILDQDR